MKSKLNRSVVAIVALFLTISCIFSSASAIAPFDTYQPLSATLIYEVVDDHSPVRDSPSKEGKVITYFDSGEFCKGTEIRNAKNNTWIEVEDGTGTTLGYIFAGHLKLHRHSFYCIYKEKQGSSISACECGYSKVKTKKEAFTVDCQSVVCELIAGNYSSQTSATAEIISNSFSAVELAACATSLTNPVSAGVCVAMSVISLAASARDLSADIYYCANDECNIAQLGVDVYGTVSGVTALHVNVSTLTGLEANRAVQSLNDIFEIADPVVSNIDLLNNSTQQTVHSNNCEVCWPTVSISCGTGPLLSDFNYPSRLSAGECFSITGKILSVSDLTTVTVGVFTASFGGNMMTGKTVHPYSATYDISNVDSSVYFNDLSEGTYWYRIIASNAFGPNVILNKRFTVGSGQSTSN